MAASQHAACEYSMRRVSRLYTITALFFDISCPQYSHITVSALCLCFMFAIACASDKSAKKLYVKGAKQDFSVSRILLMMYDNGNYVVVSSLENGSVTMNIPSNIIDKINEFF